MPAHFVLKRFMPGFEEYGDLYEAIKSGRKTVEYRDATPHWWSRLIEARARTLGQWYKGRNIVFHGNQLKHDKAVFVVGYTKYPKLEADITKIVFNYQTNKLETHLENVRENPCKFRQLECTKQYDCENCIVALHGYYTDLEKVSINNQEKRLSK